MEVSVCKKRFKPRTEKERIHILSKNQNLVRKRVEVLFFKNHFESRAEEERNYSQTLCEKGGEYYFKSHTEEKRRYKIIKDFEPCAEEGQSIS